MLNTDVYIMTVGFWVFQSYFVLGNLCKLIMSTDLARSSHWILSSYLSHKQVQPCFMCSLLHIHLQHLFMILFESPTIVDRIIKFISPRNCLHYISYWDFPLSHVQQLSLCTFHEIPQQIWTLQTYTWT